MKKLARPFLLSLVFLPLVAANACSPSDAGTPAGSAGTGNPPPVGQSGSAATSGGAASGGAGPSGGNAPTAGSGTSLAGAASGGANGSAGTSTVPVGGDAATGGSAGAANASGGSGGSGFEAGDTLPWKPLEVTAAAGEHVHGQAGMDTRAKSLGKLAVDIGVNSGVYVRWLAKRGYHSMGAPCGGCPAPNLGAGRDEVGDCRLGEFENTAASVKSQLDNLSAQYPEEGWGYFLNEDGSVRWSDVAITGISHGATTAAIAGRLAQRMWRIVSRSGPRDNTCGAAGGVCTLPLTTPSYDTACAPTKIAAWLDMPSKTPMNRFYGIVGTGDVQCGDIMFNMHHTQYVGSPVIFNEANAVLTGSNQFFSTEGGHLDFLLAGNVPLNTDKVLNIAFAIPPENQNPNF